MMQDIWKNDRNPSKWVLIWEYSGRAFQWVPTWQGLDSFQKSLRLSALDKIILSIARVKHYDLLSHSRGKVRGLVLSCTILVLTIHFTNHRASGSRMARRWMGVTMVAPPTGDEWRIESKESVPSMTSVTNLAEGRADVINNVILQK